MRYLSSPVAVALYAALVLPAFADAGPPPAQYDHAYKGKLLVLPVDRTSLARVCHDWAASACAYVGRGKCTVFIGASAQGTWRWNMLLQHEIGHCNGWPANHPRP